MFNPQPKPTNRTKKKAKYIKPRSNKRAKQEREYRELNKQYLKDNPYCKVCGMPASEVHHMKGRTGNLLTDTEYFLAVCRGCHTKIEDSPIWAKEQGFSISRLT